MCVAVLVARRCLVCVGDCVLSLGVTVFDVLVFVGDCVVCVGVLVL